MARQLALSVFVAHPAGSIPRRFRAGTAESDLPEGVAAAIVNPAAWIDTADIPAPVVAAQLVDPIVVDEDVPDIAPVGEPDGSGEPLAVAPPRTGPGSGRAAWAEFAAAMGQDVDPSAGRDDIVDALESAGLLAREG